MGLSLEIILVLSGRYIDMISSFTLRNGL